MKKRVGRGFLDGVCQKIHSLVIAFMRENVCGEEKERDGPQRNRASKTALIRGFPTAHLSARSMSQRFLRARFPNRGWEQGQCREAGAFSEPRGSSMPSYHGAAPALREAGVIASGW